MDDAMLSMFNRLEGKIDALGEKVVELSVASGVVTERLGNMAGVTQEHLSADRLVHEAMEGRIKTLEHFRTGWKARVATVGAVVGAIIAIPIAIVVSIIKDSFGSPPP